MSPETMSIVSWFCGGSESKKARGVTAAGPNSRPSSRSRGLCCAETLADLIHYDRQRPLTIKGLGVRRTYPLERARDTKSLGQA